MQKVKQLLSSPGAQIVKKAISSTKYLYGLDYRSLALFRVAFGILIFQDLFGRLVDLEAHYTDFGMIDRSAPQTAYLIFHSLNGSYGFQLTLFIMHMIVCILYTIGYKSKLMAVVKWLFLSSLVKHHYSVNCAGDALAVVMGFWGMFLPVGEVGIIGFRLIDDD